MIVDDNEDVTTTFKVGIEETNKNDANTRIEVYTSGIDPEVMPRLFSKFVSTFTQGTGLGLFISKSIIEAHGGRLWAKNNDEGKVMFSLPVSK